ncbi:MAG: hypothetical protein ACREM3_13060 [Candidatus Rokuibacteriota bacterium]
MTTPASEDKQRPDLDVLRNIAAYHREHERFHSANQIAIAADLAREANKLKVVADVWLRGDAARPTPGVDFSDPRYQAAGCDDLNALPTVAGIGILFMEGGGEPAEIRGLRARLRGMSFGMQAGGQWLAEKMDAAWEREAVLLTPELIDAAWPRFRTVCTNWRGSRDMMLAGKLLALVDDCLGKIDFTPAAIRADRRTAGRFLRAAGWMLDEAARLLARNGADLGENDLRWTEYLGVIERARAAGEATAPS